MVKVFINLKILIDKENENKNLVYGKKIINYNNILFFLS